MSRRLSLVFAASLGALSLIAAPASAQDAPAESADAAPALKIGDDAPAFDVTTWHEGEPIAALEPGKVWVVEFWATWCGPCKKSMPHLAHLQATLAESDVHVIGVSTEDAETVDSFLQERGEPVGYRIATDPDMSVDDGWMKAAKQEGIPTAFIVGRTGKVEWIGHPSGMGHVLTAVAEDRFDGAAYAAWHEAHDAKTDEFRALRADKKYKKAAALLEELIVEHEADPALYGSPGAHRMTLYGLYAANLNKPRKASAVADAIIDEAWSDGANTLNNLAWEMTTAEGIAKRDLDVALKASVRSNLLEVGNPAYLDTLARIYFELGDLEAAVGYQRDAIAHLDRREPEIENALKRYEEAAEKAGLDLPPAAAPSGDLAVPTPAAKPGERPVKKLEKPKATDA